MAHPTVFKFALTSFLAAVLLAPPCGAYGKGALGEAGLAAAIRVAALPVEGRETYALIRRGGPFAHEKDGVVFGNRERQLPDRRRGYYREYTVATPGERGRGARRIVCGGRPQVPDACWYTADHYASFRRIVE
jgi:ribonuclease T1